MLLQFQASWKLIFRQEHELISPIRLSQLFQLVTVLYSLIGVYEQLQRGSLVYAPAWKWAFKSFETEELKTMELVKFDGNQRN